MIVRRPANERGRSDLGWLDSRHTFSFGDYHDPSHTGYRALRVVNDDRVVAGGGFGRHPHRDMEIFSYVLEGALAHEDSLGTGSTIRPGDVQKMSAGTGIVHSEFNPSPIEPVRFLQVWIHPDERGLRPSYEQKRFDPSANRGRLLLIGSEDAREGSIRFHQDVDVHAAVLDPGTRVEHRLRRGRGAWLQVARGALALNGAALEEGDGAAIEGEEILEVTARSETEFLLIDLA